MLRAVRWAIKRLMRAAFELVMVRAGTYTRDLYWCCSEVEKNLPEVLAELHACAPRGLRVHLEEKIAAVQQICICQGTEYPCSPGTCVLLRAIVFITF